MKAKLLYLILLTLFFSNCLAQQKEPLPTSGLLWEITGNGLEKPSYLFGTMHLSGGMKILDSIGNFDAVFRRTTQLLSEKDDIPIRKVEDIDYFLLKINGLLKPWPVSDTTYDNILSKSDKALLDSVINSNNVLIYLFKSNHRPSYMLTRIKTLYESKNKQISKIDSSAYDPSKDTTLQVLDSYLQKKARKNNMNIVALDSGKEYNQIIDSYFGNTPQLSYVKEAKSLIDFIKNYSANDSFNNSLTSLYFSQKIGSIVDLMNKQGQQSDSNEFENTDFFEQNGKKFSKYMVVERNKMWMKKIPDLISKQSCFIAVGAAHLPGEEGLINKLRILGYSVKSLQATNN